MTGLVNVTLAERYFLKKLAGAGGMGQVYQAWDKRRSSFMAIKVIHNARFFESFIREAVSLKELAHPNIVRFYSVEQDENKGVFFIVMDWVDGKDLSGMLKKRNGPMGIGEVTQYLEGVQKALHYAHGMGLCHCDIKPGNILIRNSDNLSILSDFGLAHITQDTSAGGTLPFMAPELFTGGKVSVASDIYALGITLYQLLSGQLPFRGETKERLIQEHLSKSPPSIQKINHSLPDGIVYVIEKALAKDPRHRQSTVTNLWVEFSRYAGGSKRDAPTQSSGLYGLKGENTNRNISASGGELTIGRSKKNILRLKHLSVSRFHATIFWKQGQYFIRDHSSTMGTFVNRRKIRPNQPVPLRNGDEIRVGAVDIFEFITKRSR
jgi:eukaryotic-like serine/threonine-protein kinase